MALTHNEIHHIPYRCFNLKAAGGTATIRKLKLKFNDITPSCLWLRAHLIKGMLVGMIRGMPKQQACRHVVV